MKRILFYASALALLASCAQDEFESVRSEGAKGISFTASIGNEADTRGELTLGDQVGFFWYAEQDRINILANNNVTNSSSKGVVASWGAISATPAEYKATKSAGKGEFTAASDADIIKFTNLPADNTPAEIAAKTASFVATYQATVTNVDTDATGISAVSFKPTFGNASITLAIGQNISQYIPMYSVSTACPSKSYHSVGEKVNLEFYRPFATLGLVASGVEQYKDPFGKLQTITITTQGFTPAPTEVATPITASNISYDPTTVYKVDLANKHDLTKTTATTPGTQTTSITVNYTALNMNWKDGKSGAQLIPALSVDRSAFRTAGKKEKYTVVYKFQYITFTVVDYTDEDWNAFNTSDQPIIKALNTLDINEYPYLYTDNGSLIVNSGNFSDVFGDDATRTTIAWGGSSVAIGSVKKIISKVALTTAELGYLQNFSNLQELTLAENTSIPANTFTVAQATTKLVKLDLPKVTEIDPKFIANNATNKFTKLTDLSMPAYEFPTPSVNNAFFNPESTPGAGDGTAGTLANLDISAVKSMIPAFGILRELSFKDFNALTNVKVYEGVQLSSSAFEGCTALTDVDGTVKIDGAVAAFKSCNNGGFNTINIIGTDIPDNAFNGCTSLAKILVDGEQVVPTTVGESAFEGTAIAYMDLSKVTTLGKSAFNGASALVSANKDTQILTVGATAIPESAFEGTAVIMIDFANATSIEKDILKSTSALKQVRFLKKFTVTAPRTSGTWNTTFGPNVANVNLFVAEGQEYVSSNKLNLPWYSSSISNGVDTITFKGIYKN